MSYTIICNISDSSKIIDEEKKRWISNVLETLGISKEMIQANIIEYRNVMKELGIVVELMPGGEVNIYKKTWHKGKSDEFSGWLPVTEKNLVAQWKEPIYSKKIEEKEVYYEIKINEWSISKTRQNR